MAGHEAEPRRSKLLVRVLLLNSVSGFLGKWGFCLLEMQHILASGGFGLSWTTMRPKCILLFLLYGPRGFYSKNDQRLPRGLLLFGMGQLTNTFSPSPPLKLCMPSFRAAK